MISAVIAIHSSSISGYVFPTLTLAIVSPRRVGKRTHLLILNIFVAFLVPKLHLNRILLCTTCVKYDDFRYLLYFFCCNFYSLNLNVHGSVDYGSSFCFCRSVSLHKTYVSSVSSFLCFTSFICCVTNFSLTVAAQLLFHVCLLFRAA